MYGKTTAKYIGSMDQAKCQGRHQDSRVAVLESTFPYWLQETIRLFKELQACTELPKSNQTKNMMTHLAQSLSLPIRIKSRWAVKNNLWLLDLPNHQMKVQSHATRSK